MNLYKIHSLLPLLPTEKLLHFFLFVLKHQWHHKVTRSHNVHSRNKSKVLPRSSLVSYHLSTQRALAGADSFAQCGKEYPVGGLSLHCSSTRRELQAYIVSGCEDGEMKKKKAKAAFNGTVLCVSSI